MKESTCSSWSATMTVGQIRGYHGEAISAETLHDEIKQYQRSLPMDKKCAVKILASKIQFEDYYEFCWDINVIDYPRFPKDICTLENFVMGLARRLLKKLEQNRITICFPDRHVMLEADNAEEN
jgi:hypothetical protein